MPIVRDDPHHPDPGFSRLYGSLPEPRDLEPWLGWCRAAAGPVLYLGAGAGRLAAPLARAGIELVVVDADPEMLRILRTRVPRVTAHRCLVEELDLGRSFELVMAPSNLLETPARLAAAARHSSGEVGLELMNPHWLLATAHEGVRVTRPGTDAVEIEVDYPGGYVQVATVSLVWPEEVEDRLAEAGLELRLMRGAGGGDLDSAPTYHVLASKRAASAEIPST